MDKRQIQYEGCIFLIFLSLTLKSGFAAENKKPTQQTWHIPIL